MYIVIFKLKTNYGIREGMWGIFGLGFMLTDCTHPAMNCHMSLYNVTEWKYVNNEDAENLLFTKNTWMRKAEADELLRRIKKPIWQRNKIYQWLVKVAKWKSGSIATNGGRNRMHRERN